MSIGTANPTWGDIFESSKLERLYCHVSMKKRLSRFELWAVETAFENVTPSGIGCIYIHIEFRDSICDQNYLFVASGAHGGGSHGTRLCKVSEDITQQRGLY